MGAGRRVDFNVEQIQKLVLAGPASVADRNLMSPFAWLGPDGIFHLMVRAVPSPGQAGDTGTIWHATSRDGVSFVADTKPSIVPGPGFEDIGGCEDPTVVERQDGSYVVYYTGVDGTRSHGEMLYAVGPSMNRLEKRGIAMASSPSEGNIKEATADRTKAGRWRMFYEYALAARRSWGLPSATATQGPGITRDNPSGRGSELWDRWHLSTGPMLTFDKDMPVMFYNGATEDARWRIGWIAFDAEYTQVVDRCIEPLISPPPMRSRMATDIAFAASVVVHGNVLWLYYSRADSSLYRARLRRS